MTDKVTKVLEDFHTITPHLTVRGRRRDCVLCQPSAAEDSQD